ncbi:uncharacterized protein LOC125672352 isoform X1 [Ostrea edulis]|uniref:uncharacterized protein LOC125672352 isoform X1 n=1 Tax=Ostrea edulis TaxID=37623 RepID=UPI0024AF6E02|nr:uncharacterized protein LOC125672352 isoform X1 [Ostrea edulis]XP_055995251.1 uncharacterized protein LOC125672352 isoform X1 [Ostrea edulis]XP_055995256.1 uncharacterized protein LOC125672352 isoform X1 [Ostrea edulis]XP_055995267.1 uncharacterized protein LOC125672352 isoform X1 [Ostrea edulis]XP_055995275.1 uncharacterized protein LOC125672352 isoform X1 [Ostrea edulis]XP_055995279.1 uncharacterized protein LOC125672352 isoform X1 [Ostrea edulis]
MLSMCRLFADDNSLQQSSYNMLEIEYKLNYDLHILEKWSNKWLLKFNPSKTKAVYFSKKDNSILPKLFFQGDRLECVPVHRHLGLLLSHNLSWSLYIDSIVDKSFKKLGLLKRLKFKIGRKHLSKLYIAFIRPTLEYASIVWDGCSVHDTDKPEKVQLRAARIVTGLPIFASRESLYSETGWLTLKSRRYIAKMTTMFKICYGSAPDYLNEIIPYKHENISLYNTRNNDKFYIPKCRLELFKKSFVPDSVKQWNLLNVETREAISINSFRKNIITDITIPPSYYSFGKRYINIIHTKLRYNCILNYDLYKLNITNSPFCTCGHTNEDIYHFFFACKNYSRARNDLFNRLFMLDLVNIDTKLLLCGDVNLPLQTNITIFSVVHKFIEETCRFV